MAATEPRKGHAQKQPQDTGLLGGGAAGGDGTTDDLLAQSVPAAGHLAGGQGPRSNISVDIQAPGGGTAYPRYVGLHQALIAL